jgi:hypothetical protein
MTFNPVWMTLSELEGLRDWGTTQGVSLTILYNPYLTSWKPNGSHVQRSALCCHMACVPQTASARRAACSPHGILIAEWPRWCSGGGVSSLRRHSYSGGGRRHLAVATSRCTFEANGRGDASRADGRGTAIHRWPYSVFVWSNLITRKTHLTVVGGGWLVGGLVERHK